jgi:hypothetical protein
MYLFFVISKVNLLEIAPLFFLGATLIFIGVDLLYEWFIEVVHRVSFTFPIPMTEQGSLNVGYMYE